MRAGIRLAFCIVGWMALGGWSTLYATESAVPAALGSPPVLEGRYSVFKPPADGGRLSEAAFFDASGRTMGFGNFRGKVVLVNLWATWCPPCLKEMPSLDELQAHFREHAFVVVAICSKCGSLDDIRGFFDTQGIHNLAIYTDPDLHILPLLGVRGLPTSILVDPDGNELGRLEGDAEWASPEAKRLVEHYLDAFSDG